MDKLVLAELCLRRATAPSSCHSCKISSVVIKNWLIIGKNIPRLADALAEPIFVNLLGVFLFCRQDFRDYVENLFLGAR